jgi:hypothetical protein
MMIAAIEASLIPDDLSDDQECDVRGKFGRELERKQTVVL